MNPSLSVSSLNPLDWPAMPFLIFYVTVVALIFGAIVLMRLGIGSGAPTRPAGELNPLELAWLAYGRQHVADTVLVGFMQAGAASISEGRWFRGSEITVNARTARLPGLLEPFRDIVAGPTTRERFRDAMVSQLDALRRGLVSAGLAPSIDQVSDLRRTIFVLVAIPVMLGGLKIAVGMQRDRPVGILLVLVGLTLIFGILALTRVPFRTRAGVAAMQANRDRHARAARAPLDAEMTLAFALTGATVLAGTPYAAFGKQIQSSGGGSGCGGGDGGGGGGGCGGCS